MPIMEHYQKLENQKEMIILKTDNHIGIVRNTPEKNEWLITRLDGEPLESAKVTAEKKLILDSHTSNTLISECSDVLKENGISYPIKCTESHLQNLEDQEIKMMKDILEANPFW